MTLFAWLMLAWLAVGVAAAPFVGAALRRARITQTRPVGRRVA